MSHNKKITALTTLLTILAVSNALGGWTIPAKISTNGAYMPRLAYSGGILHALYYDWSDDVSYVRSTDLGQSWSAPIDMISGGSCYPELYASGDSVIAMWAGENDARYDENYVYRRSINGGATWDDTSRVFPNNRSDISGEYSFCFSGAKVFLVYSSYHDGYGAYFTKSSNFGDSWDNPVPLISLYFVDNVEIKSSGDSIFLIIGGITAPHRTYEVFFLRSTNAGLSWDDPDIISFDDSTTSYRPRLAMNEHGELAVCWSAESGNYDTDILIRLSHDFGRSWAPLIVNANIRGWTDHDICYAGDTLNIVSGGNIVRHTISVDAGTNWAPIDSVESNRYQSYDPAIAVTPGMIHVIWDDRRVHGPGVYYSRWEEGYIPPDSSLPELSLLGSCGIHSSNFYDRVSVDGNYAYASGASFYDTNIEIVDISNPVSPRTICSFDSDYVVSNITASGNFVYMSGLDEGGLVIYDVSNHLSPALISSMPNSYYAWDLCKRDTLVYLSAWGVINVFDVARPFEPTLVAVYDSVHYGYYAIEVKDTFIYGLTPYGLRIIDISDPLHPHFRGHYDYDHIYEGCDIAISGNYAYISNVDPEIDIVNISDPQNPIYAETYLLDYGDAYNVVVHDNYLLVAHSDLSVLDISDPGNPVMLANYEGPMRFYAVDADDEYIYARSADTFAVFELPVVRVYDNNSPHLPQHHLLLQNYPNPFNAQTTISYSLSQAGPVTLSIYNIMGQKVATLVNGIEQAGEHRVTWDAKDVASGVYYGRLESEDMNRNLKMVILK